MNIITDHKPLQSLLAGNKLVPVQASRRIDTFQNHATFLAAILAYVEMPHNCCVHMCHGKVYKTVNIDGKEVKITFHKFPDANRKIMRLKWLHAICQDVGMSWSCFDVEQLHFV